MGGRGRLSWSVRCRGRLSGERAMVDLGSIGLVSLVGGCLSDGLPPISWPCYCWSSCQFWSHIDDMSKHDKVALTHLGHGISTSTMPPMELKTLLKNEPTAVLLFSSSHADQFPGASGRSWTQTIPSGSRA